MFWLQLFRSKYLKRRTGYRRIERTPYGRVLVLESLESRITPATLIVNATTSFASDLADAAPGDTLQIEPGATIANANNNPGFLEDAASAGATTITENQIYAPGQIITITTGNDVDTVLIDKLTHNGSEFNLSLNSPLQYSHNNSDPIAVVANTFGIDKAVTIAGDPTKPPSSLFNGLTIEYFTQNGAPGTDVLRNLSLTSVTGTTSNNLNIIGDSFNIASGSNTPIAVTSQAALTIDNDTFTVGTSATLLAVVAGETNAGTIALVNDTISVIGKVEFDSILLSSTSGAISLSNDDLDSTGTDNLNGIGLTTAGDVSVNSTTVTMNGAATGDALEVTGADCNLSNITITAGSSLDSALQVTASGDLALTGTNSVVVAGAAILGIDLTANANETVSNLTAKFDKNVSQDALQIDTPDVASLSNVNLTVIGSVGNDGIDINGSNGVGSLSMNGVSVLLDSTAVDGLDAMASGNITVAGTENVTVVGALSDNGMELAAQDGNITVTSGLNLKLSSSATNGLEMFANRGNVAITGPVVVQVNGAVSNDGVNLAAGNQLSFGAFTVTLDSTAEFGIDVQAGNVSVTGALDLKAVGAVASNGIIIEAESINITDPITVALEANALIGLDLEAGSTLSVSGAIDINATGSITNGAILFGGDQSIQLTGNVSVTIAGGTGYALEMDSAHGSVIATAGIVAVVVGMMDGNSDGIVIASAAINATLADVKATAGNLSNEAGVVAASGSGLLSISNIQVIASGGTSSTRGIYLNSQDGNVSVSGVNVAIHGQTGYGIDISSHNSLSVANATVLVTGAVANDGIEVGSQGAVNLAGLTETLQNSGGENGINATGTVVNVTGPIVANLTGAVASDGISLATTTGSININAPISVNLGSTAANGMNFDSIGLISDSSTLAVNVAGNVSDAGASFQAGAGITFGGNTKVTLGGTAEYGLVASTNSGSLNNTAPITISVAGQVSDAGAEFSGASTLNNLNIALSKGSTGDGLDAISSTGNISLANTTLKVTGPVTGTGLSINCNQGNISTTNLNVNLSSSVENGVQASATNGNLTMIGFSLVVSGNVSDAGLVLGGSASLNLQNANVTLMGTSSYAFEAGGGSFSITGLNFQETGAIAHAAVQLESGSGNATFSSSTITLGSTTNVGIGVNSQGDETVSGVNFKETGIAATVGVSLESVGNLSVTGDSFTFSKGSSGSVLNVISEGGNVFINKDSLAANANVSAGMEIEANGSLTVENTSVLLNSGATIGALLYSNSGTPQVIENNTFSTSGQGTGVELIGGAPFVALVQDNNFQNNKVGVEIYGDGTNAGVIDLGGGLLGSLGGNNFKGYTGTSGNYAIVLTNTNSTSTVYALDNLFSVTNPLTVLQDAAHNSNATGTGVIEV